jgi:protein-disulfide isomerase
MADGPNRADLADAMMQKHQTTTARSRVIATIVIVVAAVAIIAAGAAFKANKDDSKTSGADAPRHSKDHGFALTPAAATGNKKAKKPKVTIELYEDFLCPSCGIFEKRSQKYLDDQVRKGTITLVYKPVPFLVGASTNRYTERAHNAAACVGDAAGVRAYWKFHHALYKIQPKEGTAGPSDAKLIALAKRAGAPKISKCVKDEKFEDWLTEGVNLAKEASVEHTPTLVVNDQILRVFGDDGNVVMPGTAELKRAIKQASRK